MAETSSLLRSHTHCAYRGFESLPLRHFSGNRPFSARAASKRCAAVAQLDRVPGYEPGGRRFESSQPRHLFRTFFREPVATDMLVSQTGFEPKEVRPKPTKWVEERRRNATTAPKG